MVSARAQMAAVLLVLGCAAAALALFAMTLNPAAASSLLPGAAWRRTMQAGRCVATDAEAASLRAGAELLLLAAGAQTLAATATVF
ncbi:hypothetical protein ACP70R_029928 [Stipagrostis hirtigluma subsp. patula]